ncbi:MAG: cytochrome ubiquinol oxidase subunit I [Candidatus Hydrogenedentes bacterium]|nr:cytochrome ubiquinol oxidase subunit I [Candidatus Hydrogenedentota bacterium]
MNYPTWNFPHIGSGWVIGIIAIVHVLISHFAIGGGFYLPMAERKALREKRDDWMQVLHGHAKFFLILTAVFGAMTGIGIWFAISLANPEGTSTLIHNFVFAWAIEWVFFLVEVTAAAVYYYTWGRIPDKLHLQVGWLYAFSAWVSLFVINGILTFMLTPGPAWLQVAGTGREATAFWPAFFNPTFWPSLFLRTLVCISLAGIWALVTASRIDAFAQPKLKEEILRWSAKWLIPAYVLMPVFFAWYLYLVPGEQRTLLALGVSTIGQGTFTQVTRTVLVTIMTSATIAVIVYFLAWRNPRDFSFSHACATLFLALAATASTEQAREMLRKPYVVGGYLYSNGVRISERDKFNQEGYLAHSPWVLEAEQAAWSAAPQDTPEKKAEQIIRGELMMRGQCIACHTRDGYRSLKRLLKERDREAIDNMLKMLHEMPKDSPYRAFMPPLVGTESERAALGDYLEVMRGKPELPSGTTAAGAAPGSAAQTPTAPPTPSGGAAPAPAAPAPAQPAEPAGGAAAVPGKQ